MNNQHQYEIKLDHLAEDILDLKSVVAAQKITIDILIAQVNKLDRETSQDRKENSHPDFDFIKRQLRNRESSDAFVNVIGNESSARLAEIDFDVSYYATRSSDIFENIISAGYDVTKLSDLDTALQHII